ncbi:MAG: hypothetical protein KGM17_02670 [Sphingomonadales bacterium]|nr:hypothetical protein [Sphingomonadales bacterium]
MSGLVERPAQPLRAIALSIAPGALCIAVPAVARTEAGVEVGVSGTVSSNPDLVNNPKTGVSGVGTIVPWVRFESELSTIAVMGNLEYQKYTNRYSSHVTAWASVNANRRLSENVSVAGGLTYRRTSTVLDTFLATGAGSVIPGSGEVQIPTAPIPDVSFGNGRTRSESYEGSLSLSVTPGERSSLSASAGFQLSRYPSLTGANSNNLHGSLGYNYQLSQRAGVNASVSFARYDFLGTRVGDGWTVTPQLGGSYRLNESVSLSGSLGASLSRSHRPDGTIREFTVFSGDLSLCKTAKRTKYCLNASRSAQSTALGGASAVNQVKFNMARAIGQYDSFSADINYSRYDSPTILGVVGRVSQFYGVSSSYSHSFAGRRLSAVVTPSFVRLTDDNGSKNNFEIRIGVRYRFGGRT